MIGLLWFLVIFPLGGVLLSLLPYPKVKQNSTLVASLITTILSIYIIYKVLRGDITDGWMFVDIYSAIIILLISGVYFLSSAYSVYFLKTVKDTFISVDFYYPLLNLFALSMLFTAVSANIGLMWIGLETSTVVSALLIVLEKKKAGAEAAWRYAIIASAGMGIALLSIIIIQFVGKTLIWYNVKLSPFAASVALALALVGFGTKIGLFPMHTWLPDAHGSAPPPISAMLSATLLPVALLTYFRIFLIAIASKAYHVIGLTAFFGAITALVASILIIQQQNFKRMFAYSTMDVMGIAVAGIAFGGKAAEASFLLLIVHAFAKSGLFFSTGNIIAAYKTKKIENVRGLLNSTQLTGITMVLGALAVTGAPPFASFIAELVILSYSFKMPLITAMLAISIFTSFLALNYHVAKMSFGDAKINKMPVYAELIPFLSVAIALVFSLGVWIYIEVML